MIHLIRTSIRHDRPVLPGLITGALFLSLPNLVATFWPEFNDRRAEEFWTGLGLILFPCALSLTVRGTFWLWLPAAALVPAATLFSIASGSPVREWALVALAESDWEELGRYQVEVLAALVLAPVSVWIFWSRIISRLPKRHRAGWLLRLVILVFALIGPLGSLFRGESRGAHRMIASASPPGLVVSAWNAWKIRRQLDGRPALAQNLTVTPVSPAPREIYVLVIGESARFRSFQINGYQRATTPLLAKIPGLLSYRDVSAPATVTLMSIPVLLTSATAANFLEAPELPGLAGLFSRAGYHTAWFSTQRKHGMQDTACSTFAADADESIFLSGAFAPGAGAYAGVQDGELLQPLRELIGRGAPRLFVVLHTMGSHQHYVDRFPAGFDRFACNGARVRGNFLSATFSAEEARDLTNAYDNSILYTDWFLSQLIDTLAATHTVSAMYYISDHGQNGGESPILPFAHGSVTRDVIQVPLIVWLSPEYRAWRPMQSLSLESHLDAPLSADVTFHTLLDLAGLDCTLLDRTRSAASDSFRPRPRLLRNLEGTLVDCDSIMLQQTPAGSGIAK